MRRILGLFAGVVTHALFAVTVWQLFQLLNGNNAKTVTDSLWIDTAMSVSFRFVQRRTLVTASEQGFGEMAESRQFE